MNKLKIVLKIQKTIQNRLKIPQKRIQNPIKHPRFFPKTVSGQELLTVFTKKAKPPMLDQALNTPLHS